MDTSNVVKAIKKKGHHVDDLFFIGLFMKMATFYQNPNYAPAIMEL
jgi:hypothetical protein